MEEIITVKINGKKYLTDKQMCEELGLQAKKSLYDYEKKGDVERIHVGSLWRKKG